jgi:hypothetical protein
MVAMVFCIGWLAIGAGLVFLCAFVVEKIHEAKEDDCRARIAATETQISSVETSITQLEILSKAFDQIDERYKGLNRSWGRMADASDSLLNYDSRIEKLFGTELEALWQDDTVTTAINFTEQLRTGAQAFLDSLNAQGIYTSCSRCEYAF